jgi:hypothetical protein
MDMELRRIRQEEKKKKFNQVSLCVANADSRHCLRPRWRSISQQPPEAKEDISGIGDCLT